MRKNISVLAILMFILPLLAKSQDSINNIDNYYIDFSVPDVGAFTMLNTTPDHISTPGTPKEFAVDLLNAVGNGKYITPGLAIEWAPFRTFQKETSLKKYSEARWFKDMQLTFGTVADSVGTKVGAGLKWTVYNGMDPLLDTIYRKELLDIDNGIFEEMSYEKFSLRKDFTQFLNSIEMRIGKINGTGSFCKTVSIHNLMIMDRVSVKNELEDIKEAMVASLDTTDKSYDELFSLVSMNSLSDLLKSKFDPALWNKYDNVIANIRIMNMDPMSFKEKMLETVTSELRKYFKNDTISLSESETIKLLDFSDRIKAVGDDVDHYNKNLLEKLELSKKNWLNSKWNAPMLAFGLGWVGISPDNKWSTLQQHTVKAYLNGQIGFKEKSKLIGLLKYEIPFNSNVTDSTMVSDIFAGLRFIKGNAKNRVSFDLGYNFGLAHNSSFNSKTLLVCAGYEFKVDDGVFFEILSGFRGEPSDFFKNSSILALGNLKFALRPKQRFGKD